MYHIDSRLRAYLPKAQLMLISYDVTEAKIVKFPVLKSYSPSSCSFCPHVKGSFLGNIESQSMKQGTAPLAGYSS